MTEPEHCRTMAEVRAGVDRLDDQIVRLLGKRFRFMAAAARIKNHRGDVRDDNRKAAVIERAEAMARTEDIPSRVVASLYEELVEASIAYELERFDGR